MPTCIPVLFPDSGHQLPSWTVEGSQIADINIVPKPQGRTVSNPVKRHVHFADASPTLKPRRDILSWPGAYKLLLEPQSTIPAEAPIPIVTQCQQFVDPAILSVGRKPSVALQNASNRSMHSSVVTLQEAPSTPAKLWISEPPKPKPSQAPSNQKKAQKSAATLSAPFSGLDPTGDLEETDEGLSVKMMSLNVTRTGKPMDGPVQTTDGGKKKSKQRARKKKDGTSDAVDAPESSRGNNGPFRGKGWRQTPMLRDSTNTSPKNVGSGGDVKRSRRQQRAMELEARNNGWATEDATDIQDLPEFDFEGNLSKFDKRTVFEQIRSDDQTADAERLVSINRLPQARPGTYGGKNLHPTENVLDSPQRGSRRGSYISSDSDATFDLDGRTSHREYSRSSTMRLPFRQNSGPMDDNVSISGATRGSRPLPRPAYAGSSSHPTNGSPVPNRFTPPESPSIGNLPHFRLASSNRSCPTVTPGGMAAIEEVAEVEFGISADIMTNDAGRGIAEVALAAINPGGRRLARENVRLNSRPVTLFLVGNHRAGARALAAARHLRNRSVKTVACILGSERPGLELDREVKKQAEMLSKLGTVVRGWTEVRNYLSRLDNNGQPEFVVEALLAPSKAYDSLSTEDQRTVVEMVSWMNRSAGRVIVSVDAPSGINGSTGETSLLSDSSANINIDPVLEVKAKHIVCIGAPRLGLLRALQKVRAGGTSNTNPLSWQIWVADIGVNRAWRLCGYAGSAEGVKFGSEWVAQVRFVEGGEDGWRI